MIEPGDTQFPNNVVSILKARCGMIDPDLFVIDRPLRNTDANQSVGVFAANWTPNEESKEMGRIQPSLSRYHIVIQSFVKDMDEVRGLNVHAILARLLRSMLYIDAPLRNALVQLQSTLVGVTEQTKRWGITQQRFFANEIRGEWLYMSVLEIWLETEII